jgi:hypothetical protein
MGSALRLTRSFNESLMYQNGDDTPLYYASLALMTFQRAFGLFPRILGKGDAAAGRCTLGRPRPYAAVTIPLTALSSACTHDCLHGSAANLRCIPFAQYPGRHRASGDPKYSDLQSSEAVDGLIILDRSVDWVTPMCTIDCFRRLQVAVLWVARGPMPL